MRNAMSAFQLCAESQKKKTWKHSTCTLTSTCQKQTERFNPCNKNDNYNLEINTLFIKLTTKKNPTRLRFESLSIKLVICENIPNGKMDGKCNCTAKLQSLYVSSSVVFFQKGQVWPSEQVYCRRARLRPN